MFFVFEKLENTIIRQNKNQQSYYYLLRWYKNEIKLIYCILIVG